MNFAVLGHDFECLRLAESAIRNGHNINWVGDFSQSEGSRLHHMQDEGEHWEDLLDHAVADAVIIGQGSLAPALRIEQVKQLVKNGIAILTTFPLCESLLEYYEIDMCRAESGAVLYHFNPLIEQCRSIEVLSLWIREGHPELGSIEQVLWTRPLRERTRENVVWHFARDVELLGNVAGRLDRMGALGSPDGDAAYAGLSVQLIGKCQVPVRWSVIPVEATTAPQLTLIAASGRVVVSFNEDEQVDRIQTFSQGEEKTVDVSEEDSVHSSLQRFMNAVAEKDEDSSTWSSALRSMELADTIEISLRRGRMIDVHSQQLTEQLSFKGTMSALGCGVLTVLVPALLFLGWVAEQVGIPVANYWPHVLLALLATFLALQILPKFLFSSPQK